MQSLTYYIQIRTESDQPFIIAWVNTSGCRTSDDTYESDTTEVKSLIIRWLLLIISDINWSRCAGWLVDWCRCDWHGRGLHINMGDPAIRISNRRLYSRTLQGYLVELDQGSHCCRHYVQLVWSHTDSPSTVSHLSDLFSIALTYILSILLAH